MIYTKTQPTHQSMPQSRIRDLGHDLLTGRGRFGTLMGSLLLPIDPLLLISMNPLLLARTRHHLRVRGFWRAAQRALPRVRQVLEGTPLPSPSASYLLGPMYTQINNAICARIRNVGIYQCDVYMPLEILFVLERDCWSE